MEVALVLGICCLPSLLYVFRSPRLLGRHAAGFFIVATLFAQLFAGLLTEKLLGSAAPGWISAYLGLIAFCWWLPIRERNVIGRQATEARLTQDWGEAVQPKRKWWHLG